MLGVMLLSVLDGGRDRVEGMEEFSVATAVR